MRTAVVVTALLALSACEKPEVKACEGFVKSGLRSPTSYRRSSVDVRNVELTAAEWDKLKAQNPLYGLMSPTAIGHRIVHIRYDAQNAYGATIREQAACRFQTNSGKLPDDQAIQAAVHHAETQRDLRGLSRSSGLEAIKPEEVPDDPDYACC